MFEISDKLDDGVDDLLDVFDFGVFDYFQNGADTVEIDMGIILFRV